MLFVDPLGLDWVDTSVNALDGFAKGAGKALGTMIYEPLATVYDFEQVAWYTITNLPEKFNATSAIGKAAAEGQSSSELIAGMGTAAVTAPVMIVDEYVSAIISGDPERIGSATFNLETILFAGSKVKLSSGLKNIIVSEFKRFIKDHKGSCLFFVERKVVKSAPKIMVTVSRWGREGLQPGDWVMKGGRNLWNYVRSGKWDPFPWNKCANFSTGKTYKVPKPSVKLPQNEGILGKIKGLVLGQRQYIP